MIFCEHCLGQMFRPRERDAEWTCLQCGRTAEPPRAPTADEKRPPKRAMRDGRAL